MKNIQNKLLSFALSGAILAAGGIALANGSSLSASAEEGISPAYSIDVSEPTFEAEQHNLATKYTWTASSGEYLHVGNNINPNYGYQTIYGTGDEAPVYKEVRIPTVNIRTTTMEYFWAQSFYAEEDGTIWESDRVIETHSDAYVGYAPTHSIVSGTLTTTYRSIEIEESSYTRIYFNLAYNGEVTEHLSSFSTMLNATAVTSLNVGGIVFYIRVFEDSIQIRTSKTITCSSTVSNTNGYGAVAIFLQ